MTTLRAAYAVAAASSCAAAALAQPMPGIFMPDPVRPPVWSLPVSHFLQFSAVFGDVDRDGRIDALVWSADWIRVLFRTETGWLTHTIANSRDAMVHAQLADFDGDGDLDVLSRVVSDFLPPAAISENIGGRTFTARSLPIAGYMTPSDVDRDGDLDLVVTAGNLQDPPLSVFRNTGGLTFVHEPAWMPAGLPSVLVSQAADFDGDGREDLLATHVLSGVRTNVLLRNTGAAFADVTAALPPVPAGVPATLVDLDGDGRRDLAFAHQAGLDVLWNRPPLAAATRVVSLPLQGISPADFDGDGDIDLLAWVTTRGLHVLWNRGPGVFDAQWLTTMNASTIGLGDVDGDGRDDVLVGRWIGEIELRCFFGGPRLVEDVAESLGYLATDPGFFTVQRPLAADFDRDGRTDVLSRGLPTLMHFARGGGRMERGERQHPGSGQLSHVVDLDGDGDRDLVEDTGSFVNAFANDGRGWFSQYGTLGYAASLGSDPVRCGDVDGDGDADILRIQANANSAPDLVLHRHVPGGFAPPALVLAGSSVHGPRCLELVDLDGDGDLDLVTDQALPAGGSLLLRNDGTGAFQPYAGFTVSLGGDVRGLTAADVDRDGDADLVTLQRTAPGLRLFVNGGGGAFTVDPTAVPFVPAGRGIRPLVADFDGDGNADVIAQCASLEGVKFLAGDGSGRFTDRTTTDWRMPALQRTEPHEFGCADLDGDGDLDIQFGFADAVIAVNHTRHLASRAVPRVGGTISLETFVEPGWSRGGVALVGAAFAQPAAPRAIAGIAGLLDLDGAITIVGSVIVPPGGGAFPTSVAVPAAPQLVGTEVFFQGLVATVGSFGFTNAVVEVVLP